MNILLYVLLLVFTVNNILNLPKTVFRWWNELMKIDRRTLVIDRIHLLVMFCKTIPFFSFFLSFYFFVNTTRFLPDNLYLICMCIPNSNISVKQWKFDRKTISKTGKLSNIHKPSVLKMDHQFLAQSKKTILLLIACSFPTVLVC